MRTPGPWRVCTDPDNGRPLEILAVHVDHRIAFLASDGSWADARLLAAAPELRVALGGLWDIFQCRPDILGLCGPHERRELQKAADALNKADGLPPPEGRNAGPA